MELAQERLIREVLARGRGAEYSYWPPGTGEGDGPPEIGIIKSRLRKTWMAGDYDRLARYMEDDAQAFYGRLSVPRGARFLDVGCGSGQLTLIAARHGADATGVDIAVNMVERARERARLEGLAARFRLADAEALPFGNAGFDVVASLAGAMFAPRPRIVARELLRVCRPGGIIAMANWTPRGFVGKLFGAISGSVAPPGVPSPALWGDEGVVRERFGAGVSALRFTRRVLHFDFPFPPGEVVRFFRACHGPTNRAFAALDRAGRLSLQGRLEALWSSHNQARGGFTKVNAEWLEVIAVRA